MRITGSVDSGHFFDISCEGNDQGHEGGAAIDFERAALLAVGESGVD